ncbi:hypothetical protein PCANC_06104 [Puccinia coronata f. sp. avenae]|uniref:Rhodanese domain-containing protein n=1 Tax=Puccinia coronata f. sp. avenae TaxID=200324 RepID=A0A2N5VTY5_9BASI|nr:hypothetical protein PCANC_06104 [Puccinia coronata f. sp. avenae]
MMTTKIQTRLIRLGSNPFRSIIIPSPSHPRTGTRSILLCPQPQVTRRSQLAHTLSPRNLLLSSRRLASSFTPWKMHTDIDYRELKPITEMPSDDVLLIDVREEGEVIQGSIPSSVNIPMSRFEKVMDLHPDDFRKTQGFPKPALDQKIIFYCRSGARSTTALQIAKDKGFKNLRNYKGSWKHSALMETLKHTNNNQPSSLGASIGAALSGAPGTDGAHLLLSDSSRLPAAELPAPMSEKPLSATTLDRKARWWP